MDPSQNAWRMNGAGAKPGKACSIDYNALQRIIDLKILGAKHEI